MPFITDEYMATGLTLTAIGLIFPARAVGGILGNLLAGIASDRLGYSKLVWIAALALAASMVLVAGAALWLLFLAGFALISIVQASLTTGINAMVADANRDGRARALNVLHGVYAVGATISPSSSPSSSSRASPGAGPWPPPVSSGSSTAPARSSWFAASHPPPPHLPGQRPQPPVNLRRHRIRNKKRPRRAGSWHQSFLQFGPSFRTSSLLTGACCATPAFSPSS